MFCYVFFLLIKKENKKLISDSCTSIKRELKKGYKIFTKFQFNQLTFNLDLKIKLILSKMSLKEFASEEEAYYYDENDINYGISFDDKYDVTKSPSQLNKQSPNHNSESSIQQFKFLIISLAFFLISIGILLNVIFSLLVICRKPGRQTSTTIITLSMSFAYLIYLSFYALKVTIYLEGDNIAKYHMYDTIDNWKYGEFMCQFVSGLPVFVKFVCRFSIIVICLERLFKIVESNFLIENDFNNGDDEQKMLNEQEEVKSNSNSKIKNKSQSNLAIKRSVFHFLLKAFKWPILPILIFIIWLVSLLATLPLFSSYRLDEPNEYSIASASSMCNSVFKFPEDINKVSTMYWNYMIYGLIIPCSICGSCLIILGIIQFYNMNSVSSFKQKNLNNTGHSSSISSSSSFTHSTSVGVDKSIFSCFKRKYTILIYSFFIINLIIILIYMF